MRPLYPAIVPYNTHRLDVEAPHSLYIEECGNPDGMPAIFLHGGPGGGCRESDRCFFDPEVYRIVLFDQRGCGRSEPHASLEHNDSQRLVADMEAIRHHLGIDRWLVFGGSWGATLALLYAEAYPDRVTALVLRGIFLCRERDIRWFYQDGASRIFPDYWRDFVSVVPEQERHDLVAAFHRRLTGDNDLERMAAAKAWSSWEGRCATLDPRPGVVERFGSPHFALAFARIEAHYFAHNAFIEPDQILAQADRLADIPGVIVHGRYDIICPVEQAFALAQAWPGAELEIIRDAGHSAGEPGTVDALVRATDQMARRLQ